MHKDKTAHPREPRPALARLLWLLVALLPMAVSAEEGAYEIETPDVILTGVPFEVTLSHDGDLLEDGDPLELLVEGRTYTGEYSEGAATFPEVLVEDTGSALVINDPAGAVLGSSELNIIPGWFAILPALVAITMALVLRQVLPALFVGIWLGSALVYGSWAGIWLGLLDTVAEYGVSAVNDWGHVAILLFSFMIGGMVGIITKNGGSMGIVNAITHWAKSPKRGQLTTWILGVAIFFDDLSNTLIVGQTMRPITDRLRVSREKLAYLVDSTAAPIATMALVTTWIGFEVGLIAEAIGKIEGVEESGYSIFLNSILYNFYPMLTLLFTFLVASSGRDFGPMYKAEVRARTLGQAARPGAHTGESPEEARERAPKADKPHRAVNAVIPILVLVLGTLAGIYVTGKGASDEGAGLREIVGNGDSYLAMLWSSLVAVLVAGVLSRVQNILTLSETVDAWFAGVRSMLFALLILVFAWSLSSVNDALHTGDFLISALAGNINPSIIPVIVFVLSALTAFATGSSWGVMGIMMPLVVPLAWAIMAAEGMVAAHDMHILYSSVSAVLAGAVWGDHCSPISDTTILSSMASGCDHIDHVRTQIPYALTVGIVGLLVGTLPAGFGVPWWICLLAGAAVLTIGLRFFGKRSDDEPVVEP